MTALPTHAPMPADRNNNENTTTNNNNNKNNETTANDTPVRPTERGAALRWALDAFPDEIRDAIADAAHLAERREAADELTELMRTFGMNSAFGDALDIARKGDMERSHELLAWAADYPEEGCYPEIDCAIDGTKCLLAAYYDAAAVEWLAWHDWNMHDSAALVPIRVVRVDPFVVDHGIPTAHIVADAWARFNDDDLHRRLTRVNALVDERIGSHDGRWYLSRDRHYQDDRSLGQRIVAGTTWRSASSTVAMKSASADLAKRMVRKFDPDTWRAQERPPPPRGGGKGGRGREGARQA